MSDYKPRIADALLKRKLAGKGAVLIQGPKWCGKTTTAEQIASSVIGEGPNSFRAARIPVQPSGNPSFQEVQSLLWHNRLPALSEPCCGQHLR